MCEGQRAGTNSNAKDIALVSLPEKEGVVRARFFKKHLVQKQIMVAIIVSGQPSRKKSGGEGQWPHIALVIMTGESDD